MFNKKKCKSCSKNISKEYIFCPYCGFSDSEGYDEEEFGILGNSDMINNSVFNDPFFKSMNTGILGKMMNSAMKMLEKEMEKEMKHQKNFSGREFNLYINGKRVDPKNIKINNMPLIPILEQKKRTVKEKILHTPKRDFRKFAGFPKSEPTTSMRRLSNKIIYEVNMPEVKSIEDVSIIKLENSIEIKAFSDKKVYSKIIPISLPIIKYNLSKGKLILELMSD
ncbi:MAG: hypothetical protein AABW81_03255 [Nanoarchaeota archaeon]